MSSTGAQSLPEQQSLGYHSCAAVSLGIATSAASTARTFLIEASSVEGMFGLACPPYVARVSGASSVCAPFVFRYDVRMSEVPQLPTSIGIILDGNRRWARENGLPQLEGHRKGFENFIEACRWVRDAGVPNLVVYAFSTENWNRKAEEVSYLMDLYRKMAGEHLKELTKENVRVRFLGQNERFAPDLQKMMQEAEEMSPADYVFTVWVCLSYGGRAEIVEAAKKLQKSGEEVTEESLHAVMWSAEMPDPDIIIRTGGEQRLSGFLTWSGVYSELFFLDTYWPAFTKEHLTQVLAEFAERERRMGK